MVVYIWNPSTETFSLTHTNSRETVVMLMIVMMIIMIQIILLLIYLVLFALILSTNRYCDSRWDSR